MDRDNNAEYQSARTIDGGSYTEEKLKRLQLPDLDGKRFLDLGCNTGFYCRYAYDRGASVVVGVDNSPRVVEIAKKSSPDLISYYDEGWEKFDFEKNAYDIVIILSAIHYAINARALVRRIRDSLADDGLLIIEGGIIFPFSNGRFTDLPLPGWRKVGDKCRHLTGGYIRQHLLHDFEWEIRGPSVMRGGDDVARYVIHARKAQDGVERRAFQVDVVEFFEAAKESSATIARSQPSYPYVSALGAVDCITPEYVSSVLEVEANRALFLEDLKFCLQGLRIDTLTIRNSIHEDLLRAIASDIQSECLSVRIG